MNKRQFFPILTLAALGALTSISAFAESKIPKVKFTTNVGEFVVELYPEKAPKTVANFLQYVKDKHYDGLIFHRVIDDFMIQAGGYDAKLQERPTRAPIEHEGQAALAKGGPKNLVGTLAMARTQAPHSASSQFFINVKDNAFLDPTIIPDGDPVAKFTYQGQTYNNVPKENLINHPALFGYTVFGKVTSGMDVVNKIKKVPTGASGPFSSDVPKTPIIIEKAVTLP